METWLDESSLTSQSLYELPYYKSIHQIRNYGKEGRVPIYLKDSTNIKPRPDLSVNNTNVKPYSIELLCNKNRNILINVLHRLLKRLAWSFEKFLNRIIHKKRNQIQSFILPVTLIVMY